MSHIARNCPNQRRDPLVTAQHDCLRLFQQHPQYRRGISYPLWEDKGDCLMYVGVHFTQEGRTVLQVLVTDLGGGPCDCDAVGRRQDDDLGRRD